MMNMKIADMPQFQKEEFITLEILRRRFGGKRYTSKNPNEVIFPVFLDDVDAYSEDSVSPRKFCDIAYSFSSEGVRVNEYDSTNVLVEVSEYGTSEGIVFCEITAPTNFGGKVYRKLKQQILTNAKSYSTDAWQKLNFDEINSVLTYDDARHGFHRGKNGEERKLMLFKKIWDKRKHLKGGKIKLGGERVPAAYLAASIDMVPDASSFNRNSDIQERFFNLIKGIGRIFIEKKMPAVISRKNGILLIVTE